VTTPEQLPALTARSVILSVLLGSHPPLLPVRTLVHTAELFGVSEGTARVALSRLVSDGDVVAEGGRYRLSTRLVQRQQDQDDSLRPVTKPWRGGWELAVAHPDLGSAAARNALGADLGRIRLAEIRTGVWGRPDNLARSWPPELANRTLRFAGHLDTRSGPEPGFRSSDLVTRLWDLDGWAKTANLLMATMDARSAPADRFVTAAAMVRHLRSDPVLPPSLLPEGWPGPRLREMYLEYRHELALLLADQREDNDRHKAL
jgi:phenylacetic acid degradation operon negative regulatory protein